MANKHNFVELVLTCGSWQEAQRIADSLLEKRLIACAKFLPVESKYRWQGDVDSAKEVMLLMESLAANFNEVEGEVKKLHSYNTFVLSAVPVEQLSGEAAMWLTEATKD